MENNSGIQKYDLNISNIIEGNSDTSIPNNLDINDFNLTKSEKEELINDETLNVSIEEMLESKGEEIPEEVNAVSTQNENESKNKNSTLKKYIIGTGVAVLGIGLLFAGLNIRKK